eukprot:scaffold34590_cov37-Attheya_sp.AAC.1
MAYPPTINTMLTLAVLLMGMCLCDAWRHDGGRMGSYTTTRMTVISHTKKESYGPMSWLRIPRGGSSSETATTTTTTLPKQKKKKKKSRSKEPGTRVVKEAIQQDPAEALGDAIRDRAHVLRADDSPELRQQQVFRRSENDPNDHVQASVASLGLALGSSDVVVG